jgi:hypothetical protein
MPISSGLQQTKKQSLRQWIRPKCQGTMTVVAVIEDPAELAMIIEWAKKQEHEPQLSVCDRSLPEQAHPTSPEILVLTARTPRTAINSTWRCRKCLQEQ